MNGTSRFRNYKPPSTDRFLSVYPHTSDHPSSSSALAEELNEDDIFSSGDFSDKSTGSNSAGGLTNFLHQSSPPSSSPRNNKSFPHSENFGILAAISDPSRPSSHFYQKPSISTSASSSPSATSASSTPSRLIPSIPKPPQERIPMVSSSSSLGRYHQSAPVNVPLLAKTARKNQEFNDDYVVDMEGEGEMLPPHEIVARSLAQSPMLACSVLEGVGRTLKGRDLRQVVECHFQPHLYPFTSSTYACLFLSNFQCCRQNCSSVYHQQYSPQVSLSSAFPIMWFVVLISWCDLVV